MNIRKDPLVNGQYYHVFSRSIAGFKIFNVESDFARFISMLDIYRYEDFQYKYSRFMSLAPASQVEIRLSLEASSRILVEILAYCVMPTHIHLILKQSLDNGTSKYMAKVLNSYARYFNATHKRVGPLWAGHFKNVIASNDQQLLHLTRYVHLNPTSAGLTMRPEDWAFSSYRQYIMDNFTEKSFLADHSKLLDTNSKAYKKFVNNQKSYQRDLAIIKNKIIEDYTG